MAVSSAPFDDHQTTDPRDLLTMPRLPGYPGPPSLYREAKRIGLVDESHTLHEGVVSTDAVDDRVPPRGEWAD